MVGRPDAFCLTVGSCRRLSRTPQHLWDGMITPNGFFGPVMRDTSFAAVSSISRLVADGAAPRDHRGRHPRAWSLPSPPPTHHLAGHQNERQDGRQGYHPEGKGEAGLHHGRRSIRQQPLPRSNPIRLRRLGPSIHPLRYSRVGDTPWLLPCGPAKWSYLQRRECVEFLLAAHRHPAFSTLSNLNGCAMGSVGEETRLKSYMGALLMSVLRLTR
jgi:hypothetical protein